ncbi:MAG: pilus assembly protein PilM [Thermodesulfobacteriota bacterium]
MSMIQKNIVGIEFNDGFIRFTEVAFGVGGEGRLVRCGSIDRGSLDDSSLSDELKKSLASAGCIATNAAISLPDKHFFQKSLSIPKLSRKDMNSYVTKEARKGLNLTVGDFFVDSAQVGESSSQGVKKIDVNLLACRKEIVLRFCAIVAGAGLVPIGLIPYSTSMLKVMNNMDGDEADGPIALIYLGENTANVVIADGDHIIFSRVLHTAPFRDQTTPAEERESHLDKIVSETRRTLLYCKKDILGRDVGGVRLAGDGVMGDEIINTFRANLDVEVSPWSLEEQSTRWQSGDGGHGTSLFAVGAAVSAIDKRGLQLVPGHLRRRKMSARAYRLCASLVFLFLAGGIISFLVQRTTVESLRGLYNSSVAAISSVAVEPTENSADDTYHATAGELEMQRKLLYHFASRSPNFQRVLKELASSMPDRGYLKKVLISREGEQGQWSVVIDGSMRSSSTLARVDDFANLVNNLESNEGFQEVSVTPIDSGRFRKNPNFHIQLSLR